MTETVKLKVPIAGIFGKRIGPHGEVPDELIKQMQKGRKLLEENPRLLLLIMGGRTQPGWPSEAAVARSLLPKGLWHRVIMEEDSESTRQNLTYAERKLSELGVEPETFTAISSPGHQRRIQYLFEQHWPNWLKIIKFDNVEVEEGPLRRLEHWMLYVMTLNNRDEKYFLPVKQGGIAFLAWFRNLFKRLRGLFA